VASYERKQEVLREENKSLRQTILTIRRTIAQAIPDSKVPPNNPTLHSPALRPKQSYKREQKKREA
jgi:hypothetical protein